MKKAIINSGNYLMLIAFLLLVSNCKEAKNETLASNNHESEDSFYCHNGAYLMEDGSIFIIGPSDEPNLRYRQPDGTTGKFFPQDDGSYISGKGWANKENPIYSMNLGNCGNPTIEITSNGVTKEGEKIEFPVKKITFDSNGNSLYGELFYPINNNPKAVVILHFGSGRSSAVENNFLQYLFPLDDIAVFVYDKQETGKSEGTFKIGRAHV